MRPKKIHYRTLPVSEDLTDVVHHFSPAVNVSEDRVLAAVVPVKKVEKVFDRLHRKRLARALPLGQR